MYGILLMLAWLALLALSFFYRPFQGIMDLLCYAVAGWQVGSWGSKLSKR